MSGFTKQAIQASFLKLLDTYPLRDITVRMLTEDCGINRKSFYYHDQDIPALLEQILADQAAVLVASYQSVRSLEECLSAVLEKLIANKRRVQNIYCSVNRDVFESALMQVCGYLTGLYVDSARRALPFPRRTGSWSRASTAANASGTSWTGSCAACPTMCPPISTSSAPSAKA